MAQLPAASTGPVVSIVLTVYAPPLSALREQLAAIEAQTSPRWECIVVNDASPTPGVAELLAAWTTDDDRRVLVDRPVNGGIAAATNDGLDRATGDIVTLCDHDDIVHEHAVERLAAHFARHPDHDVVYTDERMIDEHGDHLYFYCKPDFSPHRLLGHNYFNHLTAFRRGAIGDLRFRAEFEPLQDYDFFLRLVERAGERGRGVGHIPEALYAWRAVPGSIALDAGEKPGVSAAAERCVRAAFERRGIVADVTAVARDGHTSTAVEHRFPVPDRSVEIIPIDTGTDTASLATRIARSTADVVCITPDGNSDHSWSVPLTALVSRPGVAAAGPRIVSPDGRLLSLGRSVAPVLHDPFRGEDAWVAGPWDVFLVTREVNALAPLGLTLDRRAVADVGGLATDIGFDAAVAELCGRLRNAGQAVLASPTAELVCDPELLPDPLHDDAVDDDLARAAARVPHLRDEHFAPTGTAPLVGLAPTVITEFRRVIASGTVQLVTADVFDTIVDRRVASPSDVFVTLGRHLRDCGLVPAHVEPALFAGARIQAEHVVRMRHADDARDRHAGLPAHEIERQHDVAAPECTLEEIWAAMPAVWGGTERTDELLAAELANEVAHLHPIAPTIATLCRAVEAGLTVHLVSDIYLSADQLRSVLRACGVDERLLTHISTSADHRLGKFQGLLERTITSHGVDPSAAVHIGDNPISDVEAARRAGATAFPADVQPHHRHVAMPAAAVAERSRELGTDGGIRSAVRSALLAAGSLGIDPSYQFGAAIAGPAITGFARWVAVTADRLGADTVHCLLREGATIAELMGVVAPHGPRPTPVHASRWVDMRAAVVDGTAEELMTALARRALLTPQHVAAAFDVDVDDVIAVLGPHPIPHSHLPQACRQLIADEPLRRQILDASAALRERVLRHLSRTLVIGDGPIVFADVGWGGTIQEGLTRILRSAGVHNEVIGLYFALSTPGEERLRAGARMLSYLPNGVDDPNGARSSRAVSHNAEIIERILTPRLGTLIDIDGDGVPICRPDDDDHIPATLASAQQAMHDIARRLVEQPGGLNDTFFVDDPGVRLALGDAIADVIESPTQAIAEALGGWPHDDVAGTAHRSISGDGLETAVAYANAHDRDLIDWSETAWVGGLAARHNPTLVAQLAAVGKGIPSSALCPPGDNGISSLAAFPFESQQATLLDERPVRTGANGWSLARIRGPIESLRAVQFAAGDGSALVEIGAFEVIARDVDGDRVDIDVGGLTERSLRWHRAHPVDDRHFAHRPGGHIVLPVAAESGERIRHLEVTVGFRCWRLADDDPIARTPMTRTIGAESRRIGAAIKRRVAR